MNEWIEIRKLSAGRWGVFINDRLISDSGTYDGAVAHTRNLLRAMADDQTTAPRIGAS